MSDLDSNLSLKYPKIRDDENPPIARIPAFAVANSLLNSGKFCRKKTGR